MIKLHLFAILALIAAPISSFAQEPAATPAAASMDGVWIEAIESYPSIQKNEIDFGIGLYPFNPYYNAFAFSTAYNHAFSRSFIWEILSFNYLFTIDKALRQELAAGNEQPVTVERPSMVLSSNIMFMSVFGKFTFTDDRVRFFRTGPVLGVGLYRDSTGSYPTANVGLRVDLHVTPTFSWKIDLRNYVAVTNGFALYPIFSLSGGLSF